jgi:hypothetical protein
MTGVEPGLRGPDAAAVIFPGDVNCSGATDAIDSLQILTFASGASTTSDCLQLHGNVNCDASIDAADSVLDLRYAAGLPIDLTQSCPAIGGPPTAQALAHALNGETTPEDADWVLKLIYQRLGIGVYTGDGQQILAGNETSLDDFYLYDFESKLLAGNYVDRQLFGLDAAALNLNDAGLPNPAGAQPWTPADVLPVVAAKIMAARGDPSMVAWRLIDELALQREEPLDLTQADLDPAATYLDSIQTFLVLYDLTSGLPATASAQDIAAAATISPRTKALHNDAYANQVYMTSFEPYFSPTQWKHVKSSTAEDRTVGARLIYRVPSGDDDLLFPLASKGPLTGFSESQVLGTVSQRPVEWTAESLVPRNGKLKQQSNTKFTDSQGRSSVLFVPRTECPLATGSVRTEHHFVQVEITTLAGDFFANSLNFRPISVVAAIDMEVSHHRVVSVQGAGSDAVPSASATPCSYEGSATGVEHRDGGFEDTVTATSTNLRFDYVSSDVLGDHYELASGQIKLVAAGGDANCSGETTIDFEDILPGQGFSEGSLLVSSAGYIINVVTSDFNQFITCPGYAYHSEFVMDAIDSGFMPTTDFSRLTGSYHYGFDSHPNQYFDWTWDLHAGECESSPGPVCASSEPAALTEGSLR